MNKQTVTAEQQEMADNIRVGIWMVIGIVIIGFGSIYLLSGNNDQAINDCVEREIAEEIKYGFGNPDQARLETIAYICEREVS
tara:strand:+ start:408 stop:656 length:249 start_codon:yes stop_codon:yes gene_type:complete